MDWMIAVVAAGAAAGLGYWASAAARPKRDRFWLPEGSPLRLLTPYGTYHCRILAGSGTGLCVSAPISANARVPLREGVKVVVQAPTPNGVMTFASTVSGRNVEPPSLLLSAPEGLRVVERRTAKRVRAAAGAHGSIDGEPALVIDSGEMGSCLVSRDRFPAGELVVVGLSTTGQPALGWVLESSPDSWDGRPAYRIRVRWCERLNDARS
jgi:hypothetical protein